MSKIKRNNEVLNDLVFILITLIFSSTYFILDPSITGYQIFHYNVVDTLRPNITANAPLNSSNFSYTNITFNITVGDDNANVTNVSILGNWTGTFTINSTNSSLALANNISYFTINITQGRGFYLWSASACDNSSNCNFSSNYTFFINRIPYITSVNVSNDHSGNKSTGNLTGKFNYFDPDNDVQSLNETRWYNNTVEITTFRNFTSINYLNMTAGDNWIFSARVFDGENWSIWYNSSGHSIQNNSGPTFSGTISDQSWNEDAILSSAINLSQYFSDLENDNIVYTTIGNKAIVISIVNSLVSFSQPEDWNGVEYVVFIANDTNLTRNSNNVTLTVNSVSEPTSLSVSGGGTSRKNVAIGILTPSNKNIFLKDKIIVPFNIKNTGSEFLQSIKLTSISSDSNVKTSLDKTFFPNLKQGGEEKIILTIESNLEKEKPGIEIIVSAEVTSPGLKDSAKIYLNTVEFGASNKSVIIPRLNYVKDLFSQNKECSKFDDMVKTAETLLAQQKFNEAQELIDKAINGCNDIIVLDPKKLNISKKSKLTKNLVLFAELMIFLILIVSFLMYYKKKRLKYIES